MLGPGSITAMKFVDPFGSAASLGFIGLAHGVALLVAVYSIGNISGAHVNPAVTVSAWATHRLDKSRVIPYIVAQLVGATIAGFLQLAIWSSTDSSYSVARSTYLGDTVPGSPFFGIAAAFLVEIIGTAILVFTVFAVTDKNAERSWAGVAIGVVLAALIWIFGPISGASLNPARTWGPTIASAVFSLTPLGSLWIYVLGPIFGGLIGGFLFDALKA